MVKDNFGVSLTLIRLGPIQEAADVEGVRRKICVFCSEKDHGAGNCLDVLHSDKGLWTMKVLSVGSFLSKPLFLFHQCNVEQV
jgi:hypothetical protein